MFQISDVTPTPHFTVYDKGWVGLDTTAPLSHLSVVDAVTTGSRGIGVYQYTANAAAPLLGFFKSRGTEASPVVTNSGDVLGAFAGSAYVGTTNKFQIGAEIYFKTTAASTGDNAYGPATDIILSTGSGAAADTEKVRVPSDGGIRLATATAQANDAAHRGTINYVAGGAGVKDKMWIIYKKADDTYSAFDLLAAAP